MMNRSVFGVRFIRTRKAESDQFKILDSGIAFTFMLLTAKFDFIYMSYMLISSLTFSLDFCKPSCFPLSSLGFPYHLSISGWINLCQINNTTGTSIHDIHTILKRETLNFFLTNNIQHLLSPTLFSLLFYFA